MKKTILSVLIVLIALSGSVFAQGNQEAQSDNGIVTINYYGKPDAALENEIITRFEAENPNIQVNYIQLTGGSNEKLAQIQTVLQSKSSDIDVFAADGIWPAIFVAAGWAASYEELGVSPAFFDEYTMASNFMSGGKHYGIPFQANAGLFFYRADLLKKYGLAVPKTTAEIETAAKIILAGEKNPNLVGYAAAWKQGEGLSSAVSEFFYEQGMKVYANGTSDLTFGGVKAALDTMKGLIDKGIAPADINSYSAEQRTLFKAGKLIFARDWTSAFSAHFFKPEGNPYAVVAGAAIVPGGAGVSGNWGLMISSFSKNKKEAVAFAEFRANQQSLETQYDMIGALPPHYAAFKYDAIQKVLGSYADIVLNSFEVTVDRAVTPHYGEVSNIIQTNVSAALTGLLSTDQAATLITKQISNIL